MESPSLFSGTSNEPLAKGVAKHLGVSLGRGEITRFIDNECRVYVKENVEGKQVFVVQSLSQIADQHLVELCLIGQALKSLKAKSITAVVPWMGYSKQDKEFRHGEAVSAQLVAKFIEVAGFNRVITIELHSEHLVPFFNIPVIELSTHELLRNALQVILMGADKTTYSRPGLDNAVVASPDAGGQSRSERFAKAVGLPIVYLVKERDKVTGKVTVKGISRNVKDLDVVIFDDIINTGSTAIKTSEFLKNRGAKRIYFLATHAVLAGDASEKLEKSSIDQVIVTDTIVIPKDKHPPKLTIVSVAPILADAIKTAVQ